MTGCPRCGTRLAPDACYCHSCGVSLTVAVSGEYPLYDLERFFDYALDMLCIAGVDGFLKRVNRSFTRVLGYAPDELLGKPFADFIHPEDRSDTVAEVRKLASGAETLFFRNRYRCRDGTYKQLEWTSYPEPGTGLLYAVAREIPED